MLFHRGFKLLKTLINALKPDASARTLDESDTVLGGLKGALRPLAKAAVAQVRADDPNFIDVKKLIRELSDEDLMRSADAYFAAMKPTSEQCRKPFSNPSDSVYLTRHLGLVLDAADLFKGARVLEVGCGTGWLSIGLAQMGCEVTGVDISPAAIALAEHLKAARGPAQSGQVEFKAYDGHRLPLDDDSVDRIICYDAFHHVRDQAATLREFARVLRRGGRAAFLEPGPDHSKTPMSQAEMANHKVIENDVNMAEVTEYALAAGLDRPQMLLQLQQPFVVSVDDFNTWARDGIAKEAGARVLQTLQQQMTNGQCFFIYKGQPTRDSRSSDGLAASLRLVSARRAPMGTGTGIRLEVKVSNTGTRDWITAQVPGQVNLGVHVLGPDGALVDNNFARVRLPGKTVLVGESVTLVGLIREPALPAYSLRLDMVAELVAWFADLGQTTPLVLPSSSI